MLVLHNVSLKEYHTFRTPATSELLYMVDNEAGIAEIASLLGTSKQFLILGSGSNVLFTGDFPGIVFINRIPGITTAHETGEYCQLSVGSGVVWDDFVNYCVQSGFWGVENLSLIPGTVGAAPVQNIGAYGQEVAESIVSVEYLDLITMEKCTLSNSDCCFSYRDSIFKRQLKGKAFITSVSFRLKKNGVPCLKYLQSGIQMSDSLQEIREKIISVRTGKLPDVNVYGNAGSFFKNPVVSAEHWSMIKEKYPDCPELKSGDSFKIPAGWLIEQCGWKGKRFGDAGVYHKQALVLVNYGTATGKEILQLANDIISSVEHKFGVAIEPEVNIY